MPRAEPGRVGSVMSGILEMLARLVMLEEGLARAREPPILAVLLLVPSSED